MPISLTAVATPIAVAGGFSGSPENALLVGHPQSFRHGAGGGICDGVGIGEALQGQPPEPFGAANPASSRGVIAGETSQFSHPKAFEVTGGAEPYAFGVE